MIGRPVWWSSWVPCSPNIAIGHLFSRLFRKKAVCFAPCGLVCPRSAVRSPGVCWMGPCSASACFPITGRELRKGRLERSPACFAMPLPLQQRGPYNKQTYLQAGDMRKGSRTGPLPVRSFARLFGTQPGATRLEGLSSLSLSLSLPLCFFFFPFLFYLFFFSFFFLYFLLIFSFFSLCFLSVFLSALVHFVQLLSVFFLTCLSFL